MASVVAKTKFKTLAVKKRCTIKSFVETNKLVFKKGRGFYQLNKPEIIQDYKEIIVRRKSDGAVITGTQCREELGISKSVKKFKVDIDDWPDFDVFVQSTSVNRVLLPGTDFLYESDELAPAATPSTSTGKKAPTRGKRAAAAAKPPAKKAPVKGGAKKTEPPAKEAPPARGRKRKATEDPPEASPEKKAKATPAAKKTPAKAAAAAPDPGPAGGPVQIAFSFDTTGSMYPCLTQVRRKVSETIKRLQKEIPGIQIAIIAHGDYCDASYSYVTKILDFTTDEKKLCSFVETVGATGGGDWEECYELVIYETRTKLSWTPGTQRSLVMIGDAIPHTPSYGMNTLKLDWKKEAKQLYNDLGCRIYSVQALNNSASKSFYRDLAQLTNGYHLHLDQFASIVQFIMAICFREQSMEQLQAFEDEVRGKGTGVNRSLHKLFDTLAGRDTTYKGGDNVDGLTPVDPARFQVLDVDARQDIKSFVQKNGLIFKAGRGFYEFTKAEKISDKKEVVLIDKVTGDMFTGPEACHVIGAGGTGRIKPTCLDKWRVFVQSTSYNRVLMPNTGFLYEVDPEH